MQEIFLGGLVSELVYTELKVGLGALASLVDPLRFFELVRGRTPGLQGVKFGVRGGVGPILAEGKVALPDLRDSVLALLRVVMRLVRVIRVGVSRRRLRLEGGYSVVVRKVPLSSLHILGGLRNSLHVPFALDVLWFLLA